MKQFVHCHITSIASYLPEILLRFLERHWQLMRDPADGWNFWTQANYYKWVRNDQRWRSRWTRKQQKQPKED